MHNVYGTAIVCLCHMRLQKWCTFQVSIPPGWNEALHVHRQPIMAGGHLHDDSPSHNVQELNIYCQLHGCIVDCLHPVLECDSQHNVPSVVVNKWILACKCVAAAGHFSVCYVWLLHIVRHWQQVYAAQLSQLALLPGALVYVCGLYCHCLWITPASRNWGEAGGVRDASGAFAVLHCCHTCYTCCSHRCIFYVQVQLVCLTWH
jgi:hypothetical protein